MIGYTVAKHDGTRVIVTLEIPEDAITNINRKDIAYVNSAQHRANKAKVIKIEDSTNKEYNWAISKISQYRTRMYIVGEVLEVLEYDKDIENVCGAGIHFFITRRCAELCGVEPSKNGLYNEWYDNGQKTVEYNYINGKIEGFAQTWHPNGIKLSENSCVNGKIEGIYKQWDDKGVKTEECNYVNGVKIEFEE